MVNFNQIVQKERRLKLLKNERSNIITNLIEIKRIIKEYYEQVYANKLDKQDKMDKCLGRHQL